VKKGFTIVEILVVTVIILTALAANVVFNEPLKCNLRQLMLRYDAVNLAISQMEDLEQISRDNWDAVEITDTAGAQVNASEHMVIPSGFSVKYKVTNKIDWVEDDTGTGSTDINGPEYKEITVYCKYPRGLVPLVYEVQVRGFVTKLR